MGKRQPSFLRKIQSTLSSLDLSQDRRLALQFFLKVEEAGWLEAYPPEPVIDLSVLLKTFGESLVCVNCSSQARPKGLYCGEFCRQICKIVRYVRGCLADGRVWLPEIQSGIGSKLLSLNGGGYPAIDRKLTQTIRKQVFTRDGGRCLCCGKPANEIDHINGSFNDLENLRAICGPCNRSKAFDDARLATPKEARAITAMTSEIALRIASPVPLNYADCETWENVWRKLQSVRTPIWREFLKGSH